MCSKCPLWALTQAERRRSHWLMAATTFEWSSFLHSTNSLCFSSARRHWARLEASAPDSLTAVCPVQKRREDVIKIKRLSQVRVLHRLRWKCNGICVLSRLRNKSKFYKISSVLNKNYAKNSLALFFLWLSVCVYYLSFPRYDDLLVKNSFFAVLPTPVCFCPRVPRRWRTTAMLNFLKC